MRKFYVVGAAALAALALPATMTQAQQSINVTVDGDVVAFGGQRPVEQFGTVLVPLRGVFEKLGATVAYDGNTKTILAVRGETNVSLRLGSRDAEVDGVTRTLSVPAQAINGTTLVPLRFVSEALGAQVNWQAASRTVIVSTNGATETTAPPPTTPTTPTTPSAGAGARGNRYTYGRVTFDYELNDFRIRDRAALEAQIRRNLSAADESRLIRQEPASLGTLDVNVALARVKGDNVRATVRLSLDPNRQGVAPIVASDRATTTSRDNSIDGQAVLQAFRKARRELAVRVNLDARENP